MPLAFLGFSIGPGEMMVVGVVAVLLFGSRLPAVARSAGKSLSEFRRGMTDLQDEFRTAMRESDRAAAQPLPQPASGSEPTDTAPTSDTQTDAEEAAGGYPEPTKHPLAD